MEIKVNGSVFSLVALLSAVDSEDNSSKNHLCVNTKTVRM